MRDYRVHPETLAGDPFAAARRDERPHACNDGWVTVGQMILDEETGDEVERIEAVPCRRCADSLG